MRRVGNIVVLLVFSLCAWAETQTQVWEQAVLYPSVDAKGAPIMLSGRLSVPQDKTPKGIILIPHYTISANDEAPSNKITREAKNFVDDYVLIMPDYIGYGVTAERIHPYLAGELTAHNCIDMLIHVQPILDSLQLGIPTDSLYIVGYSQGGASAMWIFRMLEEQYADRFHVKACFAGSGPYDVATTYDEAVATNHNNLPLAVTMLIFGTSEAYDLGLEQDYFFTRKMKRAYKEYIADKQIGVIPIYFLMPEHRLSSWLTRKGMDKTQPQTERLYNGLMRSSFVHYPIDGVGDTICTDWRPQAPLYVFHSTTDHIVTFRCAQHLHQCLGEQENITWDFAPYGDHHFAFKPFFQKVKEKLTELE